LITSSGWLRSSYSISSTGTLRSYFLRRMPPASFTSLAHSLYCDQLVDCAPGANGPEREIA
jgi:hypothetical protein